MWRYLLVLFCFACRGATWYVDPYASGANNGTSWSNAWRGSSSVTWASVAAGDTVYLSGGTTEKLYLTNFTIGKYGASGQPITFKVGRDAGHNGKVVFSNAVIGPYDSRPKWVVIDGSRSDSFTAPTNWLQVTQGATAITNNIGIWMRDITSTNGVSAQRKVSPVVWYLRRPDSCTFRWLEISGMTNNGTHQYHELDGTMCYIDQGSEGSNAATNNVFEYMYIHNNMGQQFVKISGVQTNFNSYEFRYLWMPLNGEDHFEISGALLIHDCVVGPQFPNGVHNDMFQVTGSYVKIYNNWIGESQNSWMRIQTDPSVYRNDIYFYNNLVTEKVGRAIGGGTLTEPFCVVNFNPYTHADLVILSNIVFANNLFYNTVTNLMTGELCRNPLITWSRGAVTNPPILKGVKWVNNLIVDRNKGVNMPYTTNFVGTAIGYAPYTTNDVWVDYNSQSGTNTSLSNTKKLAWMDETNIFTGSGNYIFNNNTNYPSFTDKENDNFELSSIDTVALNKGFNMSYLFDYDSLNRPRNVGGAWDRGPLEKQPSDLLLWLRFEDDFSDDKLDDSSGYGNHAYRYGRPGSTYPTNFPTQVAVGTVSGQPASATGYAADFKWYPDGWGLFGRSGAYGAVTNLGQFTNMPQMTACLWARYSSVKRLDNSYDYSQDGNAALLSAGTSTGDVGAWDLGRWNQDIWLNNTRFQITTNSNFSNPQTGDGSDPVFGKAGRSVYNFPDNGYPNGDTLTWHHYAVTFSNGVVRTYYQGTNYSSSDLSAVITNLTIGWNANVAVSTAFLGVGCDTHGGTPALEDEPAGPDYPNNGFFNGQMDDVRIYSRALNDAEINAIFTGPPVGITGPQMQANRLTVGTLNAR